MSNKVIYLKSIFRGFKPNKKVTKLIDDAITDTGAMASVGTKKETKDSREFILSYTEDFLSYAVDYSLKDKFYEVLKDLE